MQGEGHPRDLEFISLVKDRQYRDALALLDEVIDVNVRDPLTQATAVHFAAARCAKPFLKALDERREDLRYFLVDGKGRLPSELAWHAAKDEEFGTELMRKEKLDAERQGIPPWPKPSPAPSG